MARRTMFLGIAIVALATVALANVHLVYVATQSQPKCIAHLKPGTAGDSGSFSAASSSC